MLHVFRQRQKITYSGISLVLYPNYFIVLTNVCKVLIFFKIILVPTENENNNLVLASLYWNPNSHIMTIFPNCTTNDCSGYILPISTVKDSCFEYRFWIKNLSNESLELITNTANVNYY